MNRIIQITGLALLFVGVAAQAEVQFELTNKSSQPIWVCVYADGDPATGQFAYDCEKQVLPNDSLSQMIANGEVEITVSIVNPAERNGNDRYRKYSTAASADNKDKILVWNHTGSANNPLYPATSKRLLGLMKSKIKDNVIQRELQLVKSKGL